MAVPCTPGRRSDNWFSETDVRTHIGRGCTTVMITWLVGYAVVVAEHLGQRGGSEVRPLKILP